VHDRRVDDNDVDELNRGYLLAARGVLKLFREPRGPLVVDPEDDHPFRVCYPLTMYALNQVRAAVLLHDQGMVYPATVNVRVAFEHAVWAEWVRLTDGDPRAWSPSGTTTTAPP